MALAVHCQLNPQVRPFVPAVMAPKLAYRREKREGGEEPVSKHQIRPGDGRWEGRRGVGWLNPRRETKTKGRNGDREREMKVEVIGLQETRRSGHTAFSQDGYLVYCSGECGDENGGKKGQGGVGLAVRTSITRAARPPEFISDRLLKVTLELRGRAEAVTFFVAYAPTEIHDASKKHAF